jgi:hypothetical protein
MNELFGLQKLLIQSSSILKSESETEILFKTASYEEIKRNIIEALRIHQSIPDLIRRITIVMTLPDKSSLLEIHTSPSLSQIEAESLSTTGHSLLKQYDNIPLIGKLIRILETGEVCTPIQFLQELCSSQNELQSAGFEINVEGSLSKTPLVNLKTQDFHSLGLDVYVLVFMSVIGFQNFLLKDSGQSFYNRIQNQGKNSLVCLGDLSSTILGQYYGITTLWDIDIDLKKNVEENLTPHRLIESTRFFDKISSPGVSSRLVVPDFFKVSGSLPDELSSLDIVLNSLWIYYSILAFSSYAIEEDKPHCWHIRIIGSKTLESKLDMTNGRVSLDGTALPTDLSGFEQLMIWAFEEKDAVKVSITRRTSALHSSTYAQLIKNASSIKVSAEAAYDLYIQESVAEVLNIQQKLSEYLLDWSQKDIEHRMKLDTTLSFAAFGGFTSVVGILVVLLTQASTSDAISTLARIIPPFLIVYLIISIFRIEQINSAYLSFLDEHLKQISYYKRILGEGVVKDIAGELEREELKRKFSRKRIGYLITILVMIAVILIYWLSTFGPSQ